MEFIKILFNIAFTMLITRCDAEIGQPQTAETTTQTPYKNNTALRNQEKIIDNSIDFQADPCEDFYQYACGEWKQLHNESDAEYKAADDDLDAATAETTDNGGDAASDSESDNYKYDRTLGMIDYLADKEVQMYFQEKIAAAYMKTKNTETEADAETEGTEATASTTTIKEPDFVIKSYKYYKSCITMDLYEPIKYLEWLEVNEQLKWPSIINTTDNNDNNDAKEVEQEDEEEWETLIRDLDKDPNNSTIADTFSWIRTLSILRKYGLNNIFIEEIIYSRKTNPSNLIIGLDKPTTDGGFKSLKSDQLKIILSTLNLSLTKEEYSSLWMEFTKFEWKIIKLNDIEDQLGPQLITVDEFPVTWLKTYISSIVNQVNDTVLKDDMTFVIGNADYMVALDELLNEYDEYFLNKYLKIRFLWHLYQREPYKFIPLDCILHIKHYLPQPFDWIFEQKHPELKEEIPKIQEIYKNLRQQFNVTLYRNRNNFETAIVDYFVNKLENINLQVGSFPKSSQAQDNLFFYNNRKLYSKLKFSSREYYANHLKMLYFNFDMLHNLNAGSLYFDIKEYEAGLNSSPYFNDRLNTINIPLSLLQPPIYHPQFTDIYKYSTLGFLLAQTLMFGFNLNGLALNETGKLRLSYKCLGNVNSADLDDEISTVSGIRLTYQTFFHSNMNNLNSNRKLFFLNFAQTWCASSKADDSLGRSHVNHALAQFVEFSKVFECSPDSHMNPQEKCYLWD